MLEADWIGDPSYLGRCTYVVLGGESSGKRSLDSASFAIRS